MTVEITSGFSWTDGKNARILHAGNRFPVMTYEADEEVSGYPASSVGSGATVDKWRPFENEVASPSDLSVTADWTPTRFIVGSDGQTLDEGTDAATTRFMQQTFTFTAEEWVVGFRIKRETLDGVRVQANDGTSNFLANVDLRDGSVISTSGGTWSIVDLGNSIYEIRGYFTPLAATGFIRISGYDITANNVTYTGTNRTIKVLRVAAHKSNAALTMDLFAAQEVKVVAIAGHNLGNSEGRVALRHDDDADGFLTTYKGFDVTDNSPIMCFQDGITSQKWVINISRAVLPEIAVAWVGDPLTMERPFYAGFTPTPMARNTQTIGNLSGSGQLLGRSKKRTTLRTQYQWSNLTYSWVRANLDGPNGFIQAAEAEPLFVAWRPQLTEDVDFVMRAETDTPAAMGARDLWTFGMTGEALAYE